MQPTSDDAVGRRRPSSGDAPDAAQPRPDEPSHAPTNRTQPVIAVTVIRSGGFAGLRRTWSAEASEDEAPHWVTLIEGCPWDAVGSGREAAGADLFVWRLDARCGDEKREAELADPDVQGPWRELIDAVREAGKPDHGRDD